MKAHPRSRNAAYSGLVRPAKPFSFNLASVCSCTVPDQQTPLSHHSRAPGLLLAAGNYGHEHIHVNPMAALHGGVGIALAPWSFLPWANVATEEQEIGDPTI
jgi:hypothetical protein